LLLQALGDPHDPQDRGAAAPLEVVGFLQLSRRIGAPAAAHVASNEYCTDDLKVKLLSDLAESREWVGEGFGVEARELAAKNPKCPKESLVALLAADTASVATSSAANPQWDATELARLAGCKRLAVLWGGNEPQLSGGDSREAGKGQGGRRAPRCGRNPSCKPDLAARILKRLFVEHPTDFPFDENVLPSEVVEQVEAECCRIHRNPHEILLWQRKLKKVRDPEVRAACERGDYLFVPLERVESAANKKLPVARLLGLVHRNASPAALARHSKAVDWLERMPSELIHGRVPFRNCCRAYTMPSRKAT
jgi:hypothetical protein